MSALQGLCVLRTVNLNNIPVQLWLMRGLYGRKDMRDIQLSSGLTDIELAEEEEFNE